ncbi:MAG TPA: molybdopterin oxidoreductase family protein [Pyrinomonadaceae bacterium]|jgi:anaerobic selenocysteine-containing dehydrogenase|nr:molybdopterin oxidoreductase family protein [Pyrinomonadaceae bacterium]
MEKRMIDSEAGKSAGGRGLRVVRAACPHDCPDTCAMLVTVEDGRAIGVAGDPAHPFTRGTLCTKVANYEQRTYSPDRIQTPLRRTGAKGEGRFEAISWDEALDEIAARYRALAESEEGAETILPYSYSGTLGLVQNESLDRRFFHRLGASLLDRTICATAGAAGYTVSIGARIGTDPERFSEARLILLWGTNTISSNVHLWPHILEAKRQGARVVAIDPRRTRTADQCDEHIAILPGTDAALALGLMHVIFAEGLEDRDYLERYTLGHAELRRRASEYAPGRVAEICGIEAETIVRLAREYATTRPAVIRTNYGLQRHAGGGMAVRTIACLPAVTGAWRDAAGGILLSTSSMFPINTERLQRPDLLPARRPRTVNMVQLGDALTELNDPPVRALYVYCSNPAAVAPEQSKVLEGLRREDLFTVVHELFMTDTCDYADIILPATSQLEQFDLHKAYGHFYLVVNEPAIEPLYESKPNTEVFRLLAARLGFKEECFRDTDVEIARQAISQEHPWLRGITLEELRARGWMRLNMPERFAPFAEGNFPTASGKCELYSEQLEALGLPAVPEFIPPRESRRSAPRLAERFPLALISPAAHAFLNSSFANLPKHLRQEKRPFVEIHPQDAAARAVADGDMVRIFNERGSCTLTAVVSTRAREGVVVSPSIWWNKLSPGETNINQLASQQLTDLGGGATFYDVLVEVEKTASVEQ